jgi:hypothetical protein
VWQHRLYGNTGPRFFLKGLFIDMQLAVKHNNKEMLTWIYCLLGGAALLFVPLKYSLVLLVGCSYVLAVIVFPYLPIYLFIVITPIAHAPGFSPYIDDILFLIFFLTVLGWGIKLRASNDEQKWSFLKYKEFHLFAILLSLIILVSSFSSISPKWTLKMATIHLIGLFLFYYFFDHLRNERCLRRSLYLFLLVSLGIASLSILQYLMMRFHVLINLEHWIIPSSSKVFLWSNRTGGMANGGYRSVGTFYHPNNLGAYLALSVPLLLSLQFYFKSSFKRLGLCLAMLVILMGIYCSASRGALINVTVSSCFLCLIFWRDISSKLKLCALGILATGAALFHEAIIDFLRLSEILSYRDIIWANTYQLIKEHLWVGHGMGTFSYEFFPRFGFPSLVDLQYILREISISGDESDAFFGIHAHNLFLNYAYEIGVMGVGVILLLYGSYLKTFISFMVQVKKDHSFAFVVSCGCMAVLLGQFVHSFFDVCGLNYLHFSYSFILILTTGILLMHRQIQRKGAA